jgi:hypothetical protein
VCESFTSEDLVESDVDALLSAAREHLHCSD